MSFLSLHLFSAVLAVSSPASVQDQTATPTVEAAAPAPTDSAAEPEVAQAEAEEDVSPEEAAFNIRSAAMGVRVGEVDAAMKAAARDPAAGASALDTLQAGFQAEMDVFVQDFINLADQTFRSLPENERTIRMANVENRILELANLPRGMREQAEAAALAASVEVAPSPD